MYDVVVAWNGSVNLIVESGGQATNDALEVSFLDKFLARYLGNSINL